MGTNIAQRRAAKAKRRKAIVAEKRKAEITATGGSLAERVRRAAAGRIVRCAVQQTLSAAGVATLILVREGADGGLTLGGFLLDSYLGAKDVVLRPIGRQELEDFYATLEETGALTDIEPADARKLLHETVARAQGFGLRPHRDFAAVEAIFGDIRIEDSTASFPLAGWDEKSLGIPVSAEAGESAAAAKSPDATSSDGAPAPMDREG